MGRGDPKCVWGFLSFSEVYKWFFLVGREDRGITRGVDTYEARAGEPTGGEDEDRVRLLHLPPLRFSWIGSADGVRFCVCRKLEAEAGQKLEGVYQQLMQAGVDRNESEREMKLKETLANLQRIFPGWHSHPYPRVGRIDVCFGI